MGLRAAGPVPGRGRGGVRAAIPAAEDLTARDRRRGRGDDRAAAQGAGRAGPRRRAAYDLLAPGASPPGPGLPGHGQPAPHPGRAGHPEPAKRPKSSYIRFAAEQPNECWQSDFTHYRLAGGTDAEILTWLDDHSRYALSVTAHQPVTGPAVLAAFRAATAAHGTPASTLTDNGLVYTTRFSGGRGGRNGLETELRNLGVRQKNGKPNHPQTQGKVERFQQTLKKWLAAQDPQPASLTGLQQLLDAFTAEYNTRRPHRSLPHRATPAAVYAARPKAAPGDQAARQRPPGPDRPRRRRRQAHPAPPRPPAPHRHRPNPRPDPSPHARPGSARPRRQRRHRRTHPRTRPQPRPRLPAHRPATRTPARNTPQKQKPEPLIKGSGRPRCPETSQVRARRDSNPQPSDP